MGKKKKNLQGWKIDSIQINDGTLTWFAYRRSVYLFTDGKVMNWYKAIKFRGSRAVNKGTEFYSKLAAEICLDRYLFSRERRHGWVLRLKKEPKVLPEEYVRLLKDAWVVRTRREARGFKYDIEVIEKVRLNFKGVPIRVIGRG